MRVAAPGKGVSRGDDRICMVPWHSLPLYDHRGARDRVAADGALARLWTRRAVGPALGAPTAGRSAGACTAIAAPYVHARRARLQRRRPARHPGDQPVAWAEGGSGLAAAPGSLTV